MTSTRRRSYRLLPCLVVAVLVPLSSARAEPDAAPSTIQQSPAGLPDAKPGAPLTRVTIGLDRKPEFLSAYSRSGPDRVFVELPDVKFDLPPDKPTGLVKSLRGGLSAPGRARVIIEVTAPVVVESAHYEAGAGGKSHSLVLELARVDDSGAAPKKALKSQPSALGGAVPPPPPVPAVRPRPVVVIDPGHGGHDTGAQKNGAVEKDVVLAFALALRDKLKAGGQYKVVMTRETDVFIPLGERVSKAETNRADLFIAVHADYANTQARGATIYSLRDSVASALKRPAKANVAKDAVKDLTRGNGFVQATSGDDVVVKGILGDFASRVVELTKSHTTTFTGFVSAEMKTATAMKHDPEKQAGFRVLRTAQFPSVLIELAYVTNKDDAELLKSEEWRDKVSSSVVTAVQNYFSHTKFSSAKFAVSP